MIEEDEELVPTEFSNLILDQMPIGSISDSDKQFLEKFVNLESISLNQTNLKDLNNLPTLEKLSRIEVNDNLLTGAELSKLEIYKKLECVKMANNKVGSLEDLAHFGKFE